MSNSGKFDTTLAGGRAFRGSHVIRDPRDLVVSGYEYHLVTTEPWVLVPQRHLGGISYQEYLRSLDPHDGLTAEIEWLASGTAKDLSEWNYNQKEFIELRYEDVLADESTAFERLFHWYGFNDSAVAFGMDTVERLSLKHGGAKPTHVRSGAPGEWATRFTPEHTARFKELTGDLVVDLGYETDSDWT
jgi:hypothetical protein